MKIRISRFIKYALYGLSLGLLFILAVEFAFPRLKGLSRSEYLCPWSGEKNSALLTTRVNEQGLTGDLLSHEVEPNKVKILTLGGSSFFYRNMTERLKDAFFRKGWENVGITGAALSAHTSRSSVLKYKYLLSDYHFDYVLIYHGINDLWTNRVAPEDFRSDYSHLDRNYKDLGSVFLKLFYDNLVWKKAPQTDEHDHYPSTEVFRRNLIYLIEAVRSRGGEVILMTFASHIPPFYSRERFYEYRLGYNLDRRFLMCPVEFWGTVEHVKEGLRRHNQAIRELAELYQVPLIDQEQLMPGNGYWFSDFCHLSLPGTRRFISHITDYFERAGIFAGTH
jgi:lysophospholipase L1-like esterase